MSEFEPQDLDQLSEPRGSTFDFRGYLFKVLNLWKFVLVCIGFALIIAYLINVRKQNIYKLSSLISVESDQNPFFTSNTSISFNWGGVSGKVGKVMTTIKTRTHNELVVDSLKYYIEYLKEGKYRLEDIHTNAPFVIALDNTKPQILNVPIGIGFVDSETFEISAEFKGENYVVQRYSDKEKFPIRAPGKTFSKTFRFGETINLPFFNGTISPREGHTITKGGQFFFRFINYDKVVNDYQRGVSIEPYSSNASSILQLSLAGSNKSKIVDYLNTTSAILSKTELERKNLYATNTIKFIDSSLAAVNDNLKEVTNEMNKFREENKLFDISAEMNLLAEKLKSFDFQKEEERSKLNYLNSLETYLRTKTDYTKIAAPTSVGITENNILASVAKITALAIERQSK
ncbi:MAG TPA: sugar transporter, partial [Aquaticitalea sp.]|nr:sugar transporter [Aquaticitalea sp.]